MSEEKLKLSQKVFAALERLIRDTRVKDFDLGFTVSTHSLDFSLTTTTDALDFAIPAQVTEVSFTIAAQVVEIVHHLTHPPINDASLEGLTTEVKDEELESIHTTTVLSEPLHITTTAAVVDLFKEYNIDLRRLSSSLSVKHIDIELLKPRVHTLAQSKLKITAQVKENLLLIKRMTLQKKPVILSFLSEKEQLVYWKQAVIQTKKEARQLQMIGVYRGIPYDCLENIKINYSQRSLNYNFKARSPGGRCELKDIALFNEISTNKVLMVLK